MRARLSLTKPYSAYEIEHARLERIELDILDSHQVQSRPNPLMSNNFVIVYVDSALHMKIPPSEHLYQYTLDQAFKPRTMPGRESLAKTRSRYRRGSMPLYIDGATPVPKSPKTHSGTLTRKS